MKIIKDNKRRNNLDCQYCGYPGVCEPDEEDNIFYYWIEESLEIVDGPFCTKTCAKKYKELMENGNL